MGWYGDQYNISAPYTFWYASDLDDQLWGGLFYTYYTTIRTVILTPIAIIFLMFLVRIAGSRALTQRNYFDQLAIVAVGSALGGFVCRPNNPLTSYVIAVSMLLAMQYAISILTSMELLPVFLLKEPATLLVANGVIQDDLLARHRLSRQDLYGLLRRKGLDSVRGIRAAVFESNGDISVIRQSDHAKELERDENSEDHRDADIDLCENVIGYERLLQQPALKAVV